jgi:hypothetical protein
MRKNKIRQIGEAASQIQRIIIAREHLKEKHAQETTHSAEGIG